MKIFEIVAFLALIFVLPTTGLGDTLVLRDGTVMSGSLVKADSHAICFQDETGASRTFETNQIAVLTLSSDVKKTSLPGHKAEPSPAAAHETSDSELIQQLLRRVAQLEATVQALKNPAPQNTGSAEFAVAGGSAPPGTANLVFTIADAEPGGCPHRWTAV